MEDRKCFRSSFGDLFSNLFVYRRPYRPKDFITPGIFLRMCGSLPTTALSSASISFGERPRRLRFRPVMNISWFRPSFIERSVAVAASIFSGVALVTTIEFAANLGTIDVTTAVLPNITDRWRTAPNLWSWFHEFRRTPTLVERDWCRVDRTIAPPNDKRDRVSPTSPNTHFLQDATRWRHTPPHAVAASSLVYCNTESPEICWASPRIVKTNCK